MEDRRMKGGVLALWLFGVLFGLAGFVSLLWFAFGIMRFGLTGDPFKSWAHALLLAVVSLLLAVVLIVWASFADEEMA